MFDIPPMSNAIPPPERWRRKFLSSNISSQIQFTFSTKIWTLKPKEKLLTTKPLQTEYFRKKTQATFNFKTRPKRAKPV